MNLGLGKQAIDFGTESVSKRSLCPAISLSLSLHYPNDRSPVLPKSPSLPNSIFSFPLFFFPRISTDTLVLILTYPLHLAPR